MTEKRTTTMTRDQAWELLTQYNQDPFHLKHAQVVEAVMRYWAQDLGYAPEEVDFWGIVGLLHDLDFEQYPEEHCVKCQELMRKAGVDEAVIRSAASHGYGMTKAEIPPEHPMEKVLFTIDELTGLIGAVAIMRPSKSMMDLEVKSVKKKFKTPSFAAGCSRETITRGVEMMGSTLEDVIQKTILALRQLEQEKGIV